MNSLRLVRALLVVSIGAGSCAARCPAQVCQLRNQGDHGSAVCVGAVDADGSAVLLTAGHLCRNAGVVEVAPEGRWISARVLARDDAGPGRDLALLVASGYRPRVTYKLGTRTPPQDAELLVAGFERAGPLRARRTRVAGHGLGYVELDVPGIGGLSGGPLLQGRMVVGVLTHNNVAARRAECTNIETIQAALVQWGLAEGRRDSAQWGVGGQVVVGRCGPGGCRPITPLYPTQPLVPYPYVGGPRFSSPYPTAPHDSDGGAAPQTPGWPGFTARPNERDAEPPSGPTPPTGPVIPGTNPTVPPDGETRRELEQIRASLNRLDATQIEMQRALKALDNVARAPGPDGPPGPQGPPGRDGAEGKPGRDGAAADAERLDAITQRLERLEAARIPVRILDNEGKTLDERTYKLGDPLEFRLVPRPR